MEARDNDACIISRDVRLTNILRANAIYVSSAGEVYITTDSFYPGVEKIPRLSPEYLDAICSRFFFGGYEHQDAIADILLLHSALKPEEYDDFYAALRYNLDRGNITIIFSRSSQ